jgi:predicted amidohydrolase YtcJ
MQADLLITNAHVLTMDPAMPAADALAVRGNRIIFVGTNAGAALVRGPQTRVVDAGQATLLPGLIDSHFHLLLGALRLDGIQLEQATTLEEVADSARSYAAQHPDLPWLVGYGLRYATGPGGRELSRHDLDAVVADRPLLLMAFDGHTAWANTRALELGGVLRGADCGPNSEVVIGPDGLAHGELREPGAFGRLRALAPKPDAPRKRQLLRQALQEIASRGITSVHNMDGNMAQLELMQAAERDGDLTLRVYMPYDITPQTAPDQIVEAVAMRDAAQGPLVRAGAVKFFMDGVIEGYTGLVLAPYADDPGKLGDANFTPEQFSTLACAADRHGLQIFVHAIGDLAVRRTLDGFSAARRANGLRDSRHRVEHIELLDPDDAWRFAEIGALASMQPYHAPIPPNYGAVWMARVGPERWARSFAWRTLVHAGARMAFGSDWPVVTYDPFVGLAAAVNRTDWGGGGTQALTLAEALAAYTSGGAYAEFEEQRKGMLRAGMLADLALLDRDIQATPPAEIAQARVLLTICDGRVVFEA